MKKKILLLAFLVTAQLFGAEVAAPAQKETGAGAGQVPQKEVTKKESVRYVKVQLWVRNQAKNNTAIVEAPVISRLVDIAYLAFAKHYDNNGIAKEDVQVLGVSGDGGKTLHKPTSQDMLLSYVSGGVPYVIANYTGR